MEDDGNHCADSEREALRDGCTQSQAIGKVVDGITEDDDPGQGFELKGTTLPSTTRLLYKTRQTKKEKKVLPVLLNDRIVSPNHKI